MTNNYYYFAYIFYFYYQNSGKQLFSVFLTDKHINDRNTDKNLYDNSLQIVSLQPYRYWQQIGPVHIRPTLTWHNIYLYQPLRTYQQHCTSFTSYVSFHLTTHHSSFYLWPNTRFHQLPTARTASHPPFNTIIYFFSEPLAPLIPSPCLNFPPQSVYFCLKPSYPLSRSLIHPVISLSLQRNRRYYPPI